MEACINNEEIYEENWPDWVDMKRFGPASRWLRILVTNALNAVDKSTIKSALDVGCGEGTLTAHLASLLQDAEVCGIDVVESGIEISDSAWKNDRLSFEKKSIEDVETKFNIVSAFEVLEHIDDWKPFLATMASKSDRYLLLSFPTGRMRPFEPKMGHFRNYQKGEVEQELDQLGFSEVHVSYAGFPFFSPFYREFCNLTDSGFNKFTAGKYGFLQKRASDLVLLSFLLSTKRKHGDQFCGLFEKR